MGIEREDDIRLFMAEEQTLLSRERTMHSCMQTGLVFISVGLVIIKFLGGIFYFCTGMLLMILGGFLIIESVRRCVRFRKANRLLSEVARDRRGLNTFQSEFLSFYREEIISQEIKEEKQSGQKNTAGKEHFP
jgi:hypothetical protein